MTKTKIISFDHSNQEKLLEKVKKLDQKIKPLFDFDLSLPKTKPCNRFFINQEKNAIIFKEPKINDNCNYLMPFLENLKNLSKDKHLHIIDFSEYIPMNLLLLIQIISGNLKPNKKIYVYSKDYQELKEYKNEYKSETQTPLIFQPLEKAAEKELIQIKKD